MRHRQLFALTAALFLAPITGMVVPPKRAEGAEPFKNAAAHRAAHAATKGRCTGSAYCSVCSNCSRCAHCGAGGTCGVCASTGTGRSSRSTGSSGGGEGGYLGLRNRGGGEGGYTGRSSGNTASSSAAAHPATPHGLRPTLEPRLPRLPRQFTGRVVGISDGDTLTVLTPSRRQVKVRLHGVDAPEKRQAFGTQAREALAALAYGRDVNVAVEDTDHYGRTVATVTTGGANVNREQVRRGMAWWYKQYAPRDAQLRDLEATAKAAQRGLWADASPTPPWQFRRDQ